MRRRVVVPRGPAGVGKSTVAAALRDALGYRAAVLDSDLFNWALVPGESNKRVVYDNLGLPAESHLRYGYDVIVSGLILSDEEQGALAALRAKAHLLGGRYWDFYCHAPLDVVLSRHAARGREVDPALIEQWWHRARADVDMVSPLPRELDLRRPVEVIVAENLQTIR